MREVSMFGHEQGPNPSLYRTVQQQHERGDLSEKYAFVSTSHLVDTMQGLGWYPAKITENRVVKSTNLGFQRHMVRFRPNGVRSILAKDDVFPEIVVVNSHDGASSIKLFAGLFRLVCLNGMIVSDASYGSYTIRHVGYADDQVREVVHQIADGVSGITDKVRDMREITLTPNEQGVFAMAALIAKYGEEDMERRMFDPSALVLPARQVDKDPTLWNTFNTVQEKLLNGGKFEFGKKDRKGVNNLRKSVKVSSISEDVRVNQALWFLAENMAKEKMGVING